MNAANPKLSVIDIEISLLGIIVGVVSALTVIFSFLGWQEIKERIRYEVGIKVQDMTVSMESTLFEKLKDYAKGDDAVSIEENNIGMEITKE